MTAAHTMTVGIVGAGMAGLACADRLASQGHRVTLFDKGRNAGGRVSSRRIETPTGMVRADHGAQYFTVRDPEFAEQVAIWQGEGHVLPWREVGHDVWVGAPTMSAVVEHMAARHDVREKIAIKSLSRNEDGWYLADETTSFGPFDTIIIAVPAEQAATLLCLVDFQAAQIALTHRSQPCWTGIYVFDQRVQTDINFLRNEGVIGWAARDSAKPGRDGPETWVVQADNRWTASHLQSDKGWVADQLLAQLFATLNADPVKPVQAIGHRWRYALTAGSNHGPIWNEKLQLGVCGDWLLGPRVECAWLSGRQLAQQIGAKMLSNTELALA